VPHSASRLLILAALAAFAALLASCGAGIDADEARLCRQVLPALDNDNARLVVGETRVGPFPHSLRIDYRAVREPPQAQAREGASELIRIRFVICRFSAERTAQGRRELTGIATEFGPMADASFYFLRRFYLEAPGAAPPDPAPPVAEGVTQAPFWLAYSAQQVIAALPRAAIYGLLAAAYALIYGLFGRILLLFGEFAALASLGAVVAVTAMNAVLFGVMGVETAALSALLALAAGALIAALHGFAASRLAFTRLKRAPGQHVLIASLGAGLALSEYLRLMQGPDLRWLPPVFNAPVPVLAAGSFTVTVTTVGLTAAGLGLAGILALTTYMRCSAYGRDWRAVADDPRAAALFGVDEARVHDRALILAAALAGVAGVIMTVLYGGMGFAGGFQLGLKALIAAILGGIGSIGGAALGGLAIAAFEALWSSTMPIEGRDMAIYALVALILIVRPGGFFGHQDLTPRRV
jgi:branched-chain amino acid transport system permease protein